MVLKILFLVFGLIMLITTFIYIENINMAKNLGSVSLNRAKNIKGRFTNNNKGGMWVVGFLSGILFFLISFIGVNIYNKSQSFNVMLALIYYFMFICYLSGSVGRVDKLTSDYLNITKIKDVKTNKVTLKGISYINHNDYKGYLMRENVILKNILLLQIFFYVYGIGLAIGTYTDFSIIKIVIGSNIMPLYLLILLDICKLLVFNVVVRVIELEINKLYINRLRFSADKIKFK